MRMLCFCALFCISCGLVAPISPETLWVTIADDVSPALLERHDVQALGVRNPRRAFHNTRPDVRLDKVYVVDAASSAVAERLGAVPGIAAVERVPRAHTALTPNDPSLSAQWPLEVIGAAAAWDEMSTGCNTVIAVIDDAIDRNHPDLAANLWVNPGEVAGNGIDDDGNGFIDDINGWDTASNDANPNPPNASFSHGTHVAGIVSAVTDNAVGVASIGYSCKLMVLKASDTGVSVNAGYDAIIYAADNGARVINCSWSAGVASTTAQSVIAYARSKGAIVVAGAGNDNTSAMTYPAAYDGVVAVAATAPDDSKAAFSSYGGWVDIAAPGVNVYSTRVGNAYGSLSGTSIAAAFVSGTLGLMAARNPGLDNDGLLACLSTSATSVDAQNPTYSGALGAGRLNAAAALACAHDTLGLPPIADFTISTTSIRALYDVGYQDTSRNAPTSWVWSFPGGTPASYAGQTPPRVTYNTPGVYNVQLTVTNANGSDTKTVTSAIEVTARQECLNVNLPLPSGWTLSNYYTGSMGPDGVPTDGWINGANVYADKEKAAVFDTSAQPQSKLWRVLIAFGVASTTQPNKVVSVRVYDGTAGAPGAQLGSGSLTMGQIMANVAVGEYSTIDFHPPITLPASHKFFVSVDVTGLAWNATTHDQLSIVSNSAGQTTPSAIWERQANDVWYHYGDAGSWNLDASLVIHPLIENDVVTAVFTTSATTICNNNAITFDATDTANTLIAWTFDGGDPSSVDDARVIDVFYAVPGAYDAFLRTIDECGQYAEASTSITVLPNPLLSIMADKTALCPGDSATLNVSGASSYTWSPSNTLSATGGSVVVATPATTTTYTVTGSAPSGCVASAAVEIDVLPAIAPVIVIDTSPTDLIVGTAVTFTANVTDAGDGATFAWTKNGVPVGDDTSTYDDDAIADGDVIDCTVTPSLPCSSSASASFTVHATVPDGGGDGGGDDGGGGDGDGDDGGGGDGDGSSGNVDDDGGSNTIGGDDDPGANPLDPTARVAGGGGCAGCAAATPSDIGWLAMTLLVAVGYRRRKRCDRCQSIRI